MTDDPRWTQLSKQRKDALLAKYRDINTDYDWWKPIYKQFDRQVLTEFGIEVTERRFSGFWSQGDGASFAGLIVDWRKMLTAIGAPELAPYAIGCEWTFGSDLDSARYCHAQTMVFCNAMEVDTCPYLEATEPLQYSAWHIGLPSTHRINDIELLLREKFVELANKLYADLEREYDHLTDDDTVINYILDYELEEIEDEEIEEEVDIT